MQIDQVIERAKKLAIGGEDAAAVISEALDRLEWERKEVAAVKEGIAAYESGDHEPLADFDQRFRLENGLPPRS